MAAWNAPYALPAPQLVMLQHVLKLISKKVGEYAIAKCCSDEWLETIRKTSM